MLHKLPTSSLDLHTIASLNNLQSIKRESMSTFLLQKCAPVDHLTCVLSVSSAIVASVPTPAAAPAPPPTAEAAGPSVPVLGVRAVATVQL